MHEGVLFAERYRIGKSLGTGGMGSVYLVEDTLLDNSEVALKILHKELTADETQLQRFLREVQLTRQITHKNIVRTFDVGQDKGRVFFTMEYVPGASLKEVLEKYGKLQLEVAVPILVDVAQGLQAIHAEDVIHRDLKPANIILSRDGLARITDFGVARPQVSELTHHSEVVGSTPYLSPEAWTGKNIEYRTDIYALGIMAYEMVNGAPPFEAESPAEFMFKHLEEAPASLRKNNPDMPGWIDHLVLSMLAKDQHQRPQTAAEVGEVLADGIGGVARDLKEAVSASQMTEEEFEEQQQAFLKADDAKKARIQAIEASLRDTMSDYDEEVAQEVITDIQEDTGTFEFLDPLASHAGFDPQPDASEDSGYGGPQIDSLSNEQEKGWGGSFRVLEMGLFLLLSAVVISAVNYVGPVIMGKVSEVSGYFGWGLQFVAAAIVLIAIVSTYTVPFLLARIVWKGSQGLSKLCWSALVVSTNLSLLLYTVFSAYKVHLVTSGGKAKQFLSALGGLSDQLMYGLSNMLFSAFSLSLLGNGFKMAEVPSKATVRITHSFNLEPYYIAFLLVACVLLLYWGAKQVYKVSFGWSIIFAAIVGCYFGIDYLFFELLELDSTSPLFIPYAGAKIGVPIVQLLLAVPKWSLIFLLLHKTQDDRQV